MKSSRQITRQSGSRLKRAGWIFGLLVAAGALFPSMASAWPLVVVRCAPRPAVVHPFYAPVIRPVVRPVVVRTVAPRPLHKVWVPGHWTHRGHGHGHRVWVPGHYRLVR